MKHIKTNRVYLAVTIDIFELPVAIFETIKEGADYCGCSRSDFCKRVKRGDIDYKNNCKYIKVDLAEEEEDNE